MPPPLGQRASDQIRAPPAADPQRPLRGAKVRVGIAIARCPKDPAPPWT